MVSLRVFDSDGDTSSAWVARAVNFAGSQNIPILNFSGGGPSFNSVEQNAIDAYEGLFVAAAGNEDNNNNEIPVYPASFPFDNIISVGASDGNDNRSDWNGFTNLWGLFGSEKSNYGDTSVDLFAPGTNILSTVPGNDYQSKSGTSMAAPMVTGAAALLLSHNPSLTTAQLRSAIIDNVDVIPALNGLCESGGRLNVNNAIRSIGYATNDLPDNKIEITGVCFSADSIEIPSQLNGKIVTSIGASAFSNKDEMTNVEIPSTVTCIGNSAFSNCTNLNNVNIPSSITSIGNYGFYNCTKLNNVTIPSNVTSIGEYAFSGCSAFTAITILYNVTSVGYRAFYNCINLAITWKYNAVMTAANFSDYLKFVNFLSTSIAANAFAGCTKLSDLMITGNITSIGSNAFYGCTGMHRIYIPSTVTTMGSNVFQNCSNLYIYTQVTSKPSGWNSTWNSSNRTVYWLAPAQKDVFSGFGYNGSTYYWTGAVRMTINGASDFCYHNTINGVFLFISNVTLTFSVRTLTSKNAWSKINGTLSFSGAYTHTSTVSVSITNSVTISDGAFSINIANLANGTYTLTLYSSFTRGSWSGSSTHTFTFIVDRI